MRLDYTTILRGVTFYEKAAVTFCEKRGVSYLKLGGSLFVKTSNWGNQAQKMIERLKDLPIDADVIDGAIGQAWKIMHSSAKSSSYIECVNSVIRRHLNTFKSIPEWFCQIFTFYWNNREMKRGKRSGSSSMKIFRPHDASERNWIDRIMEKFPFEDFRSGISWKQLKYAS